MIDRGRKLALTWLLAGVTSTASAATARLTPAPPVIDGVLDEAAWQEVVAVTHFVQREPGEGTAASESTEARFLFDGEALYVGITVHHADPDDIAAPITRPDVTADSDYVWVDLDTFHNRRSAYRFGLTAAGARLDAILADDVNVDWSWNAVWEGAVARDPRGWTAEIAIPFSILRFGSRPDWGMNLTRRIAARGEIATSSLLERSHAGWVSRFDALDGLKFAAFAPSLSWEPYLRFQGGTGAEWSARAGVDGQLALSKSWRASFTIYPDFGQVEADAAVLNLSAFETFTAERRPFFVEDRSLFDTPYNLFFSRRIGRTPSWPLLAQGESVVASPDETRVLEALRLQGETPGGLRLGLVQATTAAEDATIAGPQGERSSRRVAPSAHFTVVRAQQPFADSALGFLATALHREGERPVWSGGVDWKLRFAERAYAFDGQAALTRGSLGDRRKTGAALYLDLRRVAAHRLTGGVSLSAEDRGFQPNDVGFLQRNDHIRSSAWASLQWLEPGTWFREAYANGSAWYQSNWSRLPLGQGAQVSFDGKLASLAWVGGGLSYGLSSYDDRETRGGPVIQTPGRWDAWLYYNTDGSRPLWLSLDGSAGGSGRGDSSHGLGLTLGWKPANPLEFQLGASFAKDVNLAQWLENRDSNHDGVIDHALFARLESRVFDLSARARIAPSPRLTIEFYMQPFLAAGRYDGAKELVFPRSLAFRPFELGYDPDFTTASLYSNLVVRWEYRPGSTVIAAWSQSRYDDSEPGDLTIGRDLRQLFAAPGYHVLGLKWIHHFR